MPDPYDGPIMIVGSIVLAIILSFLCAIGVGIYYLLTASVERILFFILGILVLAFLSFGMYILFSEM